MSEKAEGAAGGGAQGAAPDMSGVLTVFANGFLVTGQLYGHQLIFTLQNGPNVPAVPVANVHVGPELLKVIGRLIRKHVLQFEQGIGSPIVIPQQILDELGIGDLEE